MLCTLKEVLDQARKGQYGVGMFNAFNVELAKGVLEAAEETKSPVIVGTAEALLPCCDLEMISSFLIPLAKKSSVPVVVHLDHAFTEDLIKKAISLGFTSVMYDCSMKSFEENVSRCAGLTAYAHKNGASVEAELGHVALDEGGTGEGVGYQYTKPQEVRDFIAGTGADALAIAIGTEHGVYTSKPVLDIERLREIRALTETNLVLHGGSGLSEEDFKSCIKNGIQKVNIYTDISIAASRAAHDYVEQNGPSIHDVSLAMRTAVREATIEKLRIFGCMGKA